MSAPQTVTLFVQCLVDGLFPEVAEAVVRVFEKLGMAVRCPADQTCCGQPAFNSGYWRQARVAASHFLRVFDGAEVIVCPSGSCVDMVRNHYPELFDDDHANRRRAEELSGRIYEFSQFLVDVLKIDDLGAHYRGRLTYHDSCHLLRGLGVKEQPRQLLRRVSGAEFVEMKDADICCGFGGTFSVKYPRLSAAMLEDKVRNILDTGADAVVGADMGCLMNIRGRLNRMGKAVKALHLAQVLASGK